MPPKPNSALQELMNFKAMANAPPPSSEGSSSDGEAEPAPEPVKQEEAPPRAPSPVPSKVPSELPDDMDVDGVRPIWRPIEGGRPLTAFDAHLIMRDMSPKVAFTVLITRLHRGANNPSPADGTNSKWSDIFAPAPPDDPRGFHEARWPETLPPYRPLNQQPGESAWADNQEYAFECVFACSNSHFAVARRLKMMKQQPNEANRNLRLSGPLCKMRFRLRGSARVPARLATLLGDDPTPFSRSSPNLLPWEFDLCSRVVLEVAGTHEPECEHMTALRDVLSPPLPWPRMSPRGELWVAQAAYRYRDMTWGALLRDVAVLRSLGPPPWVPIGPRPAEQMDTALLALYGQCFTKVQRQLRGSSQRRVTVGGLSERVDIWRTEGAQGGTVRVEARVRRGGNQDDPGIIVASHVPALAAYAAFCAASQYPSTLAIDAAASVSTKGWRVVPITACLAGFASPVAYIAISACTRASMEWSLQAVAAAAPQDFCPKYVIGDAAETVRAAVLGVWPSSKYVASFDDVLRATKARMESTNMVPAQKLAMLTAIWAARCTRTDAVRRATLAERPPLVPQPVWDDLMSRFGPGSLPPLDADAPTVDPGMMNMLTGTYEDDAGMEMGGAAMGGGEEVAVGGEANAGVGELEGVAAGGEGVEGEVGVDGEGEDPHAVKGEGEDEVAGDMYHNGQAEPAGRVMWKLDALTEARTLAQHEASYGPAMLSAEPPEEFVDRSPEEEAEEESAPTRVVHVAGARGATRAAARAAAAAAAAAHEGESDEEQMLPSRSVPDGERPLPNVREPQGHAAFPQWSLADFEDVGVSPQPSNLQARGVRKAVGWRISGVVRMLGDAIHEWVAGGAMAPAFDLPQPGKAVPKFHNCTLAERWSSLASSTFADPIPILDENRETVGHFNPVGYRLRPGRPPVQWPVPGRVQVRGAACECVCREFRECLSCVHCALVLTERYKTEHLRPDSRSLRGLAAAEGGQRKRPRGRASVTAADSRVASQRMSFGRLAGSPMNPSGLHPHSQVAFVRAMQQQQQQQQRGNGQQHAMGGAAGQQHAQGMWGMQHLTPQQQQQYAAQQQQYAMQHQQQMGMGQQLPQPMTQEMANAMQLHAAQLQHYQMQFQYQQQQQQMHGGGGMMHVPMSEEEAQQRMAAGQMGGQMGVE